MVTLRKNLQNLVFALALFAVLAVFVCLATGPKGLEGTAPERSSAGAQPVVAPVLENRAQSGWKRMVSERCGINYQMPEEWEISEPYANYDHPDSINIITLLSPADNEINLADNNSRIEGEGRMVSYRMQIQCISSVHSDPYALPPSGMKLSDYFDSETFRSRGPSARVSQILSIGVRPAYEVVITSRLSNDQAITETILYAQSGRSNLTFDLGGVSHFADLTVTEKQVIDSIEFIE